MRVQHAHATDRCAHEIAAFLMPSHTARSRRLNAKSFGGLSLPSSIAFLVREAALASHNHVSNSSAKEHRQ